MDDTPTASLLGIPKEIRIVVYKLLIDFTLARLFPSFKGYSIPRNDFRDSLRLLLICPQIRNEIQALMSELSPLRAHHDYVAKVGVQEAFSIMSSSWKMHFHKLVLVRGDLRDHLKMHQIQSLALEFPNLKVIELDLVGYDFWCDRPERFQRMQVEPLACHIGKEKYTRADIETEPAYSKIQSRAAELLSEAHRSLGWRDAGRDIRLIISIPFGRFQARCAPWSRWDKTADSIAVVSRVCFSCSGAATDSNRKLRLKKGMQIYRESNFATLKASLRSSNVIQLSSSGYQVSIQSKPFLDLGTGDGTMSEVEETSAGRVEVLGQCDSR
jgi:hypothetical protein